MARKKKIKLCIFHTEFAYSGGAEKVIFHQMDYLGALDIESVCYVAFIDKSKSYPEFIKNYEIRQILPDYVNSLFPHDLIVVLTTLFFPFTLPRYRNFDVFLGENMASPWWAFMASRFYRKPFLAWMTFPANVTYSRGIDKSAKRNSLVVEIILKLFRPLIALADKYIIGKAAVLFSCGAYAKSILEKVYNRQVVNCPPGLKMGIFNQAIFKKRQSGEIKIGKTTIIKPIMLTTLRHIADKRLDLALKVLLDIKKKKIPVSLVITGEETTYTQTLKKIIEDLKISDSVLFTGLLDESSLKKLYRYAYVYIYPMPEPDYVMGIQEAMSYGIPTVCWNKAGPTCIIEDGKTGFLAKLGVFSDFANKVERLLTDKQFAKHMGQNAYSDALQYSWEKHAKIIHDAIHEALKTSH